MSGKSSVDAQAVNPTQAEQVFSKLKHDMLMFSNVLVSEQSYRGK